MGANVDEPTGSGASDRLAVRRPCLADFPDIVAIANWATCHTAANFKHEPDTLDYWVQQWTDHGDRYPWFVAECEGRVVGFARASPYHSR